MVWAPKILDQGGAAPAGPAVERDPLKALERFDQQIATDKIDGDILSKFVEYLFQYLTETAPKPVITAAAGNKLDLYLSYHSADEDYAGAIAQALIESSVKPRIPVAELRRGLATLQQRPPRQMRRGDALLGRRLRGLGSVGSRQAVGLAGARP